MSGIRLDENHVYWRGTARVPGFTEICKNLGVIGDNPFYTEEGRAEGVAIHQWAIFLASGQEPDESPDDRIAGRVEGYRKFLRESGFSFKGGEEPVYHSSLVYACTPDPYGDLNGVLSVIDIKRGSKEPWHPLQTAAQKMALASNGIFAQNRYGLYLMDGDYRLIPHTDKADEMRWTALVTAFHAKTFHTKGGL